jgi:hypothetical protein
MKNLIILKAVTLFGLILATAILTSSCGSTKYVKCDAYKTQYPKLKAERHHGRHIKCDAYN